MPQSAERRPSKNERRQASRAERAAAAAHAATLARRARRARFITLYLVGATVVALVTTAVYHVVTAPTTTTTTTTTSTSTTTTTLVPTPADTAAQRAATTSAVAAGCPANPHTRVNSLSWKAAPAMTISPTGHYFAHFVTTAGDFTVSLDAAIAPVTVNNFVFLAQHNYYHCVIFQRTVPGFMIQGGDPTGTGSGGPGYTIADEYPKAAKTTYPLYSIAMANTGKPHTGGSQFFIVAGPSGESLSPTYSLFGVVASGRPVVAKIDAEGNPNAVANGVPPFVIQRILSVSITTS